MTEIILNLIYYSFYLLFPLLFLLLRQIYKKNKKNKSMLEPIILLIVCVVLIWARFIEPNLLVVKNYNFTPSISVNTYANNLKIAVLSDIHIGIYNNKKLLDKAVKKINKLDPDIVIMPGDFVYYANRNKLKENFSSLKDINAPKIAVLGNHDYGKGSDNISKLIKSSLELNGVLMLDNKTKLLEIKDQKVEFIGLEDLKTGNPDYSILTEKSDNVDLRFLVSHNPDIIYHLNSNSEETKKIDLMIAGHTHAGQIRIPFLYKYIIPSNYNFDKGFYNINGIDLFITPGIGNVVLPLRLFNFPEISVLNINY